RSQAEFCTSHLCGALFVPTPLPPLTDRELATLHDQLWNTLRNMDPRTRIVVYCKKGKRAKIAKEIIENLGFHSVTALGGVDEPPLNAVFTAQQSVWPVCWCKQPYGRTQNIVSSHQD